jgi:hypothetical protein
MKQLFTLLLFVAFTATAQVPGAMIKDIAFKSEAELTAKYGKPVKVIETPEEDLILNKGNYTLTWNLKGQKITVFYIDKSFKKAEFVTIYNFKFNDDFYKSFGWDKPITSLKGNNVHYNGLKGVNGFFNIERNFLIIRFDNPKPTTFGKH